MRTRGDQSTSSVHAHDRFARSPGRPALTFSTRSRSSKPNRCVKSASRSLGPTSGSSLIICSTRSITSWNSCGDANGLRSRAAASTSGDSVVIFPEHEEIAIEIFTNRLDLAPEATSKLPHELAVSSWGLLYLQPANGADRLVAHVLGCDCLDRALPRTRPRATPEVERADELVDPREANPGSGVGLDQLYRRGVLDVQEAQHPTHGRLVVGAKVLVDENQHLVGRERGMVALQLLHVAHVLRVYEQLRLGRVAWQPSALRTLLVERQRLTEIGLDLDVGSQELKVQRAQEARGLAQDRDDARLRLHRRDPARGGLRPKVTRRGLTDSLLRRGRLEQ